MYPGVEAVSLDAALQQHMQVPLLERSPRPPTLPPPPRAVIANLEHRHSYVRKNAVLALNAIYKLPKGELLVPDAPEVIEKLLQVGGWSGRRCRGGRAG